MKKLLCLALSIFAITSLTACDLSREYIYSGDFEYTIYYSYYSNSRVAGITGLSEEGKTKDTLIFPNIIDEYEVESIGFNYYANPVGEIIVENATNIYFPNTLYDDHIEIIYEPIDKDKTMNIFVSGEMSIHYSNLYSNLHNLENYTIYTHHNYIYYDSNFTSANISYYIDDSTGTSERGIYFIDDVDGELIVNIPPTPIKEGYEFAGWYKDMEYTQTWDFNNDIVPLKEYDEEGNYLFKETALYAKWIEIIE